MTLAADKAFPVRILGLLWKVTSAAAHRRVLLTFSAYTAEGSDMDETWHTVFNSVVEERPVITQVSPHGLLKVITTPVDEVAPERVRPDQELIAVEIEEHDWSELARALRGEGFSEPAVRLILSKANAA
jgi:hypothetical protein